MKEMGIDNKVVIITGASSGIGRETALGCAKEGASMMLVARDKNRLQQLAQQIRKTAGVADIFPADVTDDAAMKKMVSRTIKQFGGIDILVNAAGIIANGTIENTSLKDWDYMMNLNLRAVFHLMQLTLPSLIRRRGNIVNVSSVTGLRAFPGVLAYCVSKAGLDQLTRCAALELAPKGVRINAVNPGVTRTELHRRGGMDENAYQAFLEHSQTTHPIGRVGEAKEIADLIIFLISPHAGWITGVTYSVDGGRAQTCAR